MTMILQLSADLSSSSPAMNEASNLYQISNRGKPRPDLRIQLNTPSATEPAIQLSNFASYRVFGHSADAFTSFNWRLRLLPNRA
jgi:hypothetical protein